MYLHLGQNTVVRQDEIVGIFDLEKTSIGAITREFLKTSEENMEVTDLASDLPRSFVVTEEEGGRRLYLSQISPATLLHRCDFLEEENFLE